MPEPRRPGINPFINKLSFIISMMTKTNRNRIEMTAIFAAVCVLIPLSHGVAQEASKPFEVELPAVVDGGSTNPVHAALGEMKIDEAAMKRAQDETMLEYRTGVMEKASRRDANMARIAEITGQIEQRKAEIVKEDTEAGSLKESIGKLSKELEENTIALEKIYGGDDKLNELYKGLDDARADMVASQKAVRDEIRRQHAERRLVAQKVAEDAAAAAANAEKSDKTE